MQKSGQALPSCPAQRIGFDRLELDAWVEDYKSRNGRPGRSKGGTSIRSTDLLVLDCDDFHRFIDRNPEIGAHVRAVAQGRSAELIARAP